MRDEILPELFWISGSPPSWRVMLALTLKGVAYESRRLDHGRGENKTPAYLKLNPKGQVPTLRHGPVVVRESIAILAYSDRAWPDHPIFGRNAAESAAIWQDVMVFEVDLRPAASFIAPALLRGSSDRDPAAMRAAVDQLLAGLDQIEARLSDTAFLSGNLPTAADCWLFPTLGWIDRAIAKTSNRVAPDLAEYAEARPALSAWRQRVMALPGVAETYPPHWAEAPAA